MILIIGIICSLIIGFIGGFFAGANRKTEKSQIKFIEDFGKKLKDKNPFMIVGSDISKEDLAYSQGYNDHYTKINDKIDSLVDEFKQSI